MNQTSWKVFDPYEARAVENLLATIDDCVGDGEIAMARKGLAELMRRFDTTQGDRKD